MLMSGDIPISLKNQLKVNSGDLNLGIAQYLKGKSSPIIKWSAI